MLRFGNINLIVVGEWWIVNLMEGMLFELCDEVLADGEEEKAVTEGEGVCRPSCDSNPHLGGERKKGDSCIWP